MNTLKTYTPRPFIAKETAFVADLHGDHFNAIKYDLRPWADVQTMWPALVKNWRRVVKPHWTVYALGDLFVTTDRDTVLDMLKELTGHIKLIPGNHDEALVELLGGQLARKGSGGATLYWDKGSLELMPALFELRGHGVPQPMWLCHYAMESWAGARKGVWHLHGHTHPKLDHLTKPFDPSQSYFERQLLINPFDLRPHRLNLCMGMLHAGQPEKMWAPLTWSQLVALMREHQRAIVFAQEHAQISTGGVSMAWSQDVLEQRLREATGTLERMVDQGSSEKEPGST